MPDDDDIDQIEVSARHVSQTLDRLSLRKREYMGIPQGVLDDLRGFCRADRSCWDPDPRMHAVMEGRREVWLRIQQHLELTDDQLLRLYSGGKLGVELLKGTEYAR